MCDWEGLPGSERLVSRKLEIEAGAGYSCIRELFVDGALSRDLLLPKLVSGQVDVSELEIGSV